jgi:ferredoxin
MRLGGNASRHREETKMAVKIDKDACIACGACIDACPLGIIEVNNAAELTDEDACIECGACVDACPVDAISL